jgi:hypothetical protein
VHLAGDPCAFLFVGSEQVVRERAVHPQKPALVDDQCGRKRRENDSERQRRHQK